MILVPACLSKSNQKSTTTNAQMPQNLITCIYQTHICNTPTNLTLTWSKTLFSHSFTLYSPHSFSITISLYPSTFLSLFKTRPGSKSVYLTRHHHYQKIKLYWDFSRAEFAPSSAEPDPSSFYIGIAYNGRIEFFLGDLKEDLIRRSGSTTAVVGPTLLSRREHAFGRGNYVTRAQFLGPTRHDIGIECKGGVLRVKIDGEVRLVVKRLAWKFRGNERLMIGGLEVEFYWDVFNWVNNNGGCGGSKFGNGHGVFVFQVGDGGVLPEMVGPERKLVRKSLSSVGTSTMAATPLAGASLLSPSPSCSSVLQWAEESSDGGRSSCSSSTASYASGGGFSFLLYAWRKD